jgi:hypothetical protein
VKTEVTCIHNHEHNGDENQLKTGKLKFLETTIASICEHSQAKVDHLLVEIGDKHGHEYVAPNCKETCRLSGMSLRVSGRPRYLIQISLGTARRDLSPLRTKKNREASKLRKRKIKDGESLEEWEARCLRDNMGKKARKKK